MKKFFLSALLAIGSSFSSFAQLVFSCSSKYDANEKVYIASSKYDADLVVFECKSKYDAVENKVLWFFTEGKYNAKKENILCRQQIWLRMEKQI